LARSIAVRDDEDGALDQPALARARRLAHEQPHGVVNRVVGVCRESVRLALKAREGAVELLRVGCEGLQGLDVHPEGHYGEERGALGEKPGEDAQGRAQPRQLLARHAPRNVQREDERERALLAASRLDVEERDGPLFAVLVEPEILLPQSPHGLALRVRHRHIHGHQVCLHAQHVVAFVLLLLSLRLRAARADGAFCAWLLRVNCARQRRQREENQRAAH
jgi:hypothetical protein